METNYDLIIIGGGPAGLAAGIYGGRAMLKTLILEKSVVGGRAYTTGEIVNYPGVGRVSGPDLTKAMKQQAESFGTEIKEEAVKSVDFSGDPKKIRTRRNQYTARAVIIATGTTSRVLGIPGERELAGQGVAYCATCDAEFFQGKHVVVVGSGDQAIEESMLIAKYASRVSIVVLHEEGILDCNRQAAEKVRKHPKIDFIWNSTLTRINGENHVTGVTIRNSKDKLDYDYPCDGAFFFVGTLPETGFLKESQVLNPQGWIKTNDRMETEIGGVFAAGDVREKYLRQVSTAASDGATAATAAERYLEEINDFETLVFPSESPVILGFWSPDYPGGLDAVMRMKATASPSEPFMEVDVSRKKYMASRFGIHLSESHPAAVIRLMKGTRVGELL